ncbi:MAG: response regulator transcription factor [Crocinitomicaceae bacterium]|nr:response regulator transcription factor [Crocinitomicaceae bacterium]
MQNEIRIAIVDDQTLFREGLSELLLNRPNIDLKIKANSGKELLFELHKQDVDVVLIDYKMPDMNGLEVTESIKKMSPSTRILIMSVYNDRDLIIRSIEAGARGFISKNSTAQDLMKAIQDVYYQGYYADQETTQDLIQSFFVTGKLVDTSETVAQFTDQEMQVIKLICQELSTKEIAEQIFRGVRTVEGIRSNILKKTGAKNSSGIVMYAIRHGLIDL